MKFEVIRLLRTPHSERFMLQNDGKDLAAIDIHYLLNGKVAGTLILFEGGAFTEKDMPAMLSKIDEVLLPEISIEEHNLSFTVVMGKVLGNYLSDNVKK